MTPIKNALSTVWSECLDAGKLLSSELSSADAGAKLGKTILAAYEDIGRHCGFLIPASHINLKNAFVQLNNLSSLISPFTRFSEYIQGSWKPENKDNWWVGTGDGYKAKALLTASQTVEAVRILQSNYILSVTDHLFNVLGRVSVFQTAATWMKAFPYGAAVSNVAMKVTGLEMIKNILLLVSAYYGLRKNTAEVQAASTKIEKGLKGQGKWEERKTFFNADQYTYTKTLFITQLREAKNGQLALTPSEVESLQQKQGRFVTKYGTLSPLEVVDGVITEKSLKQLEKKLKNISVVTPSEFVEQQIVRAKAKEAFGKLELAKASRGINKEWLKATVISFACGIPFGILANPVILGAFTTVLFVFGTYGLWCIRQDKKDEAVRKKLENDGIKEIPFAAHLANTFKPQQAAASSSAPKESSSDPEVSAFSRLFGSDDDNGSFDLHGGSDNGHFDSSESD